MTDTAKMIGNTKYHGPLHQASCNEQALLDLASTVCHTVASARQHKTVLSTCGGGQIAIDLVALFDVEREHKEESRRFLMDCYSAFMPVFGGDAKKVAQEYEVACKNEHVAPHLGMLFQIFKLTLARGFGSTMHVLAAYGGHGQTASFDSSKDQSSQIVSAIQRQQEINQNQLGFLETDQASRDQALALGITDAVLSQYPPSEAPHSTYIHVDELARQAEDWRSLQHVIHDSVEVTKIALGKGFAMFPASFIEPKEIVIDTSAGQSYPTIDGQEVNCEIAYNHQGDAFLSSSDLEINLAALLPTWQIFERLGDYGDESRRLGYFKNYTEMTKAYCRLCPDKDIMKMMTNNDLSSSEQVDAKYDNLMADLRDTNKWLLQNVTNLIKGMSRSIMSVKALKALLSKRLGRLQKVTVRAARLEKVRMEQSLIIHGRSKGAAVNTLKLKDEREDKKRDLQSWKDQQRLKAKEDQDDEATPRRPPRCPVAKCKKKGLRHWLVDCFEAAAGRCTADQTASRERMLAKYGKGTAGTKRKAEQDLKRDSEGKTKGEAAKWTKTLNSISKQLTDVSSTMAIHGKALEALCSEDTISQADLKGILTGKVNPSIQNGPNNTPARAPTHTLSHQVCPVTLTMVNRPSLASTLFGAEYSSDVTGDGPPKSKYDKSPKSVTALSVIDTRFDDAPGTPQNLGLDSHAQISGTPVTQEHLHFTFRDGTEPAAVNIAAVTGGEITLTQKGKATFRVIDHDTLLPFDLLVDDCHVAPTDTWTFTILSWALLLKQHHGNKVISIENPSGDNYLGLRLVGQDGCHHRVRIHIEDDTFWLSARLPRELERDAAVQSLINLPSKVVGSGIFAAPDQPALAEALSCAERFYRGGPEGTKPGPPPPTPSQGGKAPPPEFRQFFASGSSSSQPRGRGPPSGFSRFFAGGGGGGGKTTADRHPKATAEGKKPWAFSRFLKASTPSKSTAKQHAAVAKEEDADSGPRTTGHRTGGWAFSQLLAKGNGPKDKRVNVLADTATPGKSTQKQKTATPPARAWPWARLLRPDKKGKEKPSHTRALDDASHDAGERSAHGDGISRQLFSDEDEEETIPHGILKGARRSKKPRTARPVSFEDTSEQSLRPPDPHRSEKHPRVVDTQPRPVPENTPDAEPLREDETKRDKAIRELIRSLQQSLKAIPSSVEGEEKKEEERRKKQPGDGTSRRPRLIQRKIAITRDRMAQLLAEPSDTMLSKSAAAWDHIHLVGKRTSSVRKSTKKRRPGIKCRPADLRYGYTLVIDWKILSRTCMGGHKNILVTCETYTAMTKSTTSKKRDAATAVSLLEEALDYYDACHVGPAQRLILRMESDHDSSFVNSTVKRLASTRRVSIGVLPPNNDGMHREQHIGHLEDMAREYQLRGCGDDWSFGAAWIFAEYVRNRFMPIGDRSQPPLQMALGDTPAARPSGRMLPFLSEVSTVGILADDSIHSKQSPDQQSTLYTVGNYQYGSIGIHSVHCKETKFSHYQYRIVNELEKKREIDEQPDCFKYFQKHRDSLPAMCQNIRSPFNAMRQGLIEFKAMSPEDRTKFLTATRKGLIKLPHEVVLREHDMIGAEFAEAATIPSKRPRKRAKSGTKTPLTTIPEEPTVEPQAVSDEVARIDFEDSSTFPPELKSPTIPTDVAAWTQDHEDVCMHCNTGGELIMCKTCHRCTHYGASHEACTDHNYIKASAEDDKDWYCGACLQGFVNGEYIKGDNRPVNISRPIGTPDWEGAEVIKDFHEHGLHHGIVTSYDEKDRTYTIAYDDGDVEDLDHDQLMDLRPRNPDGQMSHSPSIERIVEEEDIHIQAQRQPTVGRGERATKTAGKRTRKQTSGIKLRRSARARRIVSALRRRGFSNAKVSLKGAQPTVDGIPIEFQSCDSPETAEDIEDCDLASEYTFHVRGSRSRPQIVISALVVEDEDNPRPKTVLNPSHPQYESWVAAIASELFGLSDKNVFEPVHWRLLSEEQRKNILTSKLVLKIKRKPEDGTIDKYKARLVAGGHRAKQGVHYEHTATPGACMTSPRLICARAATDREIVYGWDINQAYVQSELKQGKIIHIFPPPEVPLRTTSGERIVLKVVKNLYGLPSAGHDHFTSLDDHMTAVQDLERSLNDHNLYATRVTYNGKTQVAACFCYVDDGLMVGPHSWRRTFKQRIQGRFIVGDPKPATASLNMQIEQSLLDTSRPGIGGRTGPQRRHAKATITLKQSTYLKKVLTDLKHTPFVEPSQVPRRRTPMDKCLADQLDVRIPRHLLAKLSPGETGQEEPHLISDGDSRSVTTGEDLGRLTTDDTSHDCIRWSLAKLQTCFDYRRIVAQLNYAARCTRVDLCMPVSILSRHLVDTPLIAYRAIIQVLRYVAHHLELGVTYHEGESSTPTFYCDSDFPRGRPRCGYIAMINGAAFDWQSTLSSTIALSTAEAELYAALIAQKRALTVRKDLETLGFIAPDEPLDFREDNSACLLNLQRRVTEFSRMKHIENAFLKSLEWAARGRIAWSKEHTDSMLADFLTKILPEDKYIRMRDHIMGIRIYDDLRPSPAEGSMEESKA